MSKFLKSLIRNPLIAIAVLAAAGNISNFESTPNVSSAVVTQVSAAGWFRGSIKAEKSYPAMLKAEDVREKNLRLCLVANSRHGLCQISGKGKADQVRTELSDKGLSDWTYKMDDAGIKRVMARVQEYLPLIKTEVEDMKKMGTLPELCRPAPEVEKHAQQSADEIAKKPALRPEEALRPELDAMTSGSTTGSGSDSADEVDPSLLDDDTDETASQASATSSTSSTSTHPSEAEVCDHVEPVEAEVDEPVEGLPEQSDDPFQEVYEYVRDSVLSGASQESKNILKESSVARVRAITVIAAGLKNAVIDASTSGSREASEALGYGFDDAVARAVNELVEGM